MSRRRRGATLRVADPRDRWTFTVVFVWSFEAILIALALASIWLGAFAPSNRARLTNTGILLLPLVWLMLVVNLVGIEVDAIYERGLSNGDATLWEALTARGFQEFGEISRIGMVTDPGTGREGLVLFAGPGMKIRLRPFWNSFSDDFYDDLKGVLKRRCPSANWVFVPLDKNLKRRVMTWWEALRTSPGRGAHLG
jgi:hypothetical protein